MISQSNGMTFFAENILRQYMRHKACLTVAGFAVQEEYFGIVQLLLFSCVKSPVVKYFFQIAIIAVIMEFRKNKNTV